MGRHSSPDPDEADGSDQPSGSEPVGPADRGYEDTGYDERGYFGSGSTGYEQAGYEAGYEQADYEHADYDGYDGGAQAAGHYEDTGYEQPAGRPGYREPAYGDDEYDDQDAGYWSSDHADTADEYETQQAGPEMDAPTRSFAASAPRASASGPQHGGNWEGGDWTGSHRAIGKGRRGVSKSVIAALVAVVVLVGAVILWRFFGDALHSRSQLAAARCVSGDVAVAVVADPTIAEDISGLADEYNKTAAPVGDKCVKVGVKSADSSQVVDGFVGQWPGDLGDRPALWIPGSSVSAARLEAAAGKQTVTTSRSLVTSPVQFAVRPELKQALAQQNWSAIPGLQSNQNALDGLNLSGWGGLRAALPLAGNGDAVYAAAEAVAASAAPPNGPATAGTGAVTTLLAGQPKLADTNLSTAFDALLRDGSPAASPVHAVVTTEQQIYKRSAGLAGAKEKLAAWQPGGPTARADYPAVQLAGDFLSREQVTAASEFDKYLHKPEALGKLVAAGFRAEGSSASLPKNDVVSFGDVAAPLATGDDESRATIADAVGAPARSQAVTILLDQSMNASEGGKSRVANVTAALNARLKTLPANSSVGLWTFDGVSGRSEVAQGPLSDPVNGDTRAAVLTSALDGQTASNGGAVSFTTLRLLYPDAVANFREGQENSVLVITAGPHTDQSLDGAGLQSFIKSTFAPARPVAVNVIDFGGDPDRATWEAVAQSTGGNYQNLNSSAGPELPAAVATAIG